MWPPPSVESVLTTLLHLFWVWRICSVFYATYSVSDFIAPASASSLAKALLMLVLVVTSAALQLVPRDEYPRISLLNRLMSIPTQAYDLYFTHKYIGGALDSRRVNIFLYIVTVILIMETLYMISVDWSRIE